MASPLQLAFFGGDGTPEGPAAGTRRGLPQARAGQEREAAHRRGLILERVRILGGMWLRDLADIVNDDRGRRGLPPLTLRRFEQVVHALEAAGDVELREHFLGRRGRRIAVHPRRGPAPRRDGLPLEAAEYKGGGAWG